MYAQGRHSLVYALGMHEQSWGTTEGGRQERWAGAVIRRVFNDGDRSWMNKRKGRGKYRAFATVSTTS